MQYLLKGLVREKAQILYEDWVQSQNAKVEIILWIFNEYVPTDILFILYYAIMKLNLPKNYMEDLKTPEYIKLLDLSCISLLSVIA